MKLMVPNRKFIREGQLYKIGQKAQKAKKARYCFLFSDMMLYGEFISNGFILYMVLPLEKLTVEDIPDSKKLANAFSV